MAKTKKFLALVLVAAMVFTFADMPIVYAMYVDGSDTGMDTVTPGEDKNQCEEVEEESVVGSEAKDPEATERDAGLREDNELETIIEPKTLGIDFFSASYWTVTDVAQLQGIIDSASDGDGIILYLDSTATLPAALTINKSLMFFGPSNDTLTLNPASGQRHINVSGDDVTLTFSNITLDGNTDANGSLQGGIKSTSNSLTLSGVIIQNCASTIGGGVYSTGNITINAGSKILNNAIIRMSFYDPWGGGIYSEGAVTVDGSIIDGNKAYGTGGGICAVGDLVITNSEITNNSASNGNCGGAYGEANISVADSNIIGNKGAAYPCSGGGIMYGGSRVSDGHEVFITNCEISSNEAGAGGGIDVLSASHLTITDCVFNKNISDLAGGIFTGCPVVEINDTQFIENKANDGNGAAIYSIGPVSITDSDFIENVALYTGGAIYAGDFDGSYINPTPRSGTVTVDDCLFESNQSLNYGGGSIYAANAISITDSEFKDNNSGRSGGAVYGDHSVYVSNSHFTGNKTGYNNGNSWSGGAIYGYNGITVENNSTFTENVATWRGGAVYGNFTVTVTDSEFTLNESVGSAGGAIYAGNAASITGSALEGNKSGATGGAVHGDWLVTVNNSEFADNKAGLANGYGGGAIYAYSTLDISNNSKFTGNEASGHGGAVRANWDVTVENSEFSNNETLGHGGAICVWNSGATIAISNSVISDNRADTANGLNSGGGIYAAGPAIIKNGSIIANNTADQYGGGVYVYGTAAFTVADSEITGNTAVNGDGGAFYAGGQVNITAATAGATKITGNSAPGGAGGGIYIAAYNKLMVGAGVEFSGNTAKTPLRLKLALLNDVNTYYTANINPDSVSTYMVDETEVDFENLLNNYDVNYTGSAITITYDANGAEGTPETAGQTVLKGQIISAPGVGTMELADCQLAGWSTDPDAETPQYAPGDDMVFEISTILYAVWQNTYTLTIQAGTGGSITSGASGNYAAGDVINIESMSDSNYSFIGWTSDNGGSFADATSANTTFTMPGNDVTITANFSYTGGSGGGGKTTYSVTYNNNGGTGSDYRVAGLSSGSEHTVLSASAVGISREDYTFKGWNTTANGGGTAYAIGDSITMTRSVTLYAQWSVKIEDTDPPLGLLETGDHIVYLSGYPDGTGRPDNDITRAETAAIFYRLLSNPGTASGGQFSDVSSGAWYAQAVNYLASIGILSGYSEGVFKSNEPITRAEFATMASRFDDLAAANGSVFSDVLTSHWATSNINSAYAKGWINGYPDGTFRPENSITRAEVVTIVNAMLSRQIDADALAKATNPYSDITTSHWAYANIIEASIIHEYITVNGVEIWQ